MIGTIMLWVLGDRLQRGRIRRLDTAEDRGEIGVPHQLQDFRPLGDVQCRLAGKPHLETGALLPCDQMRQQVERCLAIADEVVVDEIDRSGQAAFEQLVELGDQLFRPLQTRIAAV
jgi:hypothetical protein